MVQQKGSAHKPADSSSERRIIRAHVISYDKAFEGYRTDITEEQVQAAPSFYGGEGDDLVWPDRKRERELRDYWHDSPRGPI